MTGTIVTKGYGLIGTCCIQGTTIGKSKNWQKKQLEMT